MLRARLAANVPPDVSDLTSIAEIDAVLRVANDLLTALDAECSAAQDVPGGRALAGRVLPLSLMRDRESANGQRLASLIRKSVRLTREAAVLREESASIIAQGWASLQVSRSASPRAHAPISRARGSA